MDEHTRSRMKTVVGVGALVVAAGALVVGAAEYKASQVWKSTELAAQELDKLRSDPLLEMALLMLDWDNRTFVLPDKYVIRDPYSPMGTSGEVLDHALWRLRDVITCVSQVGESCFREGDRVATVYVDVFDRLFTYLEQVNHYIKIGLIRESDVESLAYWLVRIEELRVDGHTEPIFRPYLERYRYTGVLELTERLRHFEGPQGWALTHPCTNRVIGHTAPAVGEYVFYDGFTVAVANIETITEDEADREIEELADRCARGAWANDRCWLIWESSTSCSGCCMPVSGGHRCWERCIDT